MSRMSLVLSTALVASALVLAPVRADAAGISTTTIEYAEASGAVANPARGFYRHTETNYREDGSGYVPLDRAKLESFRAEGTTQILRVFYMEKFADQPVLDQRWLDLVEADYATARAAGVSVITRFAYAKGGAWPYSPPYGDAPVETVLAHIRQLAPVLQRNSDVIPVVQAGFIGLWGEGYYTDSFVADPANPGVVTEADWANRSRVYRALLDAIPNRPVQVRTMQSKQKMFGVPTGAEGALTAAQAYDGSDISRIGHHNDCFLASPDDYGTFLSDPLALDQQYLEQESRFVPVGGETCAVNPPRSEWASASVEMARYKYSYLNRDYNQDVLNSWGEQGIAETRDRLGYRFVMTSSSVTGGVSGGVDATVSVGIRNDGWAAPYLERPVQLVLKGANRQVVVPVNSDPRVWAPGTTTTVSVRLPGVAPGDYRAYLALPAADKGTAEDPRYAIQLANAGTWLADSGLNDLKQTVTVAPPAGPVSIPVPPAPVWTDTCGPADNGKWTGYSDTAQYSWNVTDHSTLNGKVGIVVTAKPGYAFPDGARTRWTQKQDNSACTPPVPPQAGHGWWGHFYLWSFFARVLRW